MVGSERPITAMDHCCNKGLFQSMGMVLDQQLDEKKLKECALRVLYHWPEISVIIKRKFSLGEFYAVATEPEMALDVKSRTLNSSIADKFPIPTGSSSSITMHPINNNKADGLFHFETPSAMVYGLFAYPVVLFRITHLTDACILGLSIPHILVDGAAINAIMRAIASLYRGETLAPRLGDPQPDILSLLPPRSYRPSRGPIMLLGLWNAVKFFAGATVRTYRGIEETLIHFPSPTIMRLRASAREYVKAQKLDIGSTPISRIDVLGALMAKWYAATVEDPSKPFDFYHLVDLRPLVPGLPEPYLHNLTHFIFIQFPSTYFILNSSIEVISAEFRKAVNTQRTTDLVHDEIHWHEQNVGQFAITPLLDSTHGWGVLTSWNKFELQNLGFGGGAKVKFIRPRMQAPGETQFANIAYANNDADGGMWVVVTCLPGMQEKLGDLEKV